LDVTTPTGARALLAALDRDEIKRAGFAGFVRRAWHVVEPTSDLEWNWHLDEYCVHAEACMPPWHDPDGRWARPLIKDLVVNVPPGSTKTMIWSVMWPAWVWTWRPEARFIYVSYHPSAANAAAEKHYKLVTDPWYTQRWPHVMPIGRQGVTEFETRAKGWRYTTSIGGPLTSKHADVLVVDDPVKPSDADASAADTGAMVKKAVNWLGGTAGSRSYDKTNFVNVMVMQRITEYDPSQRMLERPGVVHLMFPALFEPERACVTPFGADRRIVKGEAISPTSKNASEEAYNAEAAKHGGWHSPTAVAQLQQRPSPPGGLMFKEHNFGKFLSGAYPVLKSFNVISVDANFKNADDASDIGIVRAGATLPKMRVYAAYSERGGFDYTLKMIDREIKEGGRPSAFLIEDKANGTAIIEQMRKKYPNVVALIPTESKMARAHAANIYYEGRATDHATDMRGMGITAFEHALSTFPRGLKKDVIDALTQALLYLASKDQEAWKRAANAWDSADRGRLGGLEFDDLFSIG
jgi:phage terminase large subunit-like protein